MPVNWSSSSRNLAFEVAGPEADTWNRKTTKRVLCPMINAKIIQVAAAGDMEALIRLVEQCLPRMNLVNLTTALHRIAKNESENPSSTVFLHTPEAQSLLQELLGRILSLFASSQPGLNNSRRQALSNVLWSLGSLRIAHLSLMEVLIGHVREQLLMFKPFELVTTLWALVKLAPLHPSIHLMVRDVQEAALAPTVAVLGQLGFRCLAMVSWALAAGKLGDEHVFADLAGHLLRMMNSAEGKQAVWLEVAWSFSVAAAPAHKALVLHKIAEETATCLDSFSDHDLEELWSIMSIENVQCAAFFDAYLARTWTRRQCQMAQGNWHFEKNTRSQQEMSRWTGSTLVGDGDDSGLGSDTSTDALPVQMPKWTDMPAPASSFSERTRMPPCHGSQDQESSYPVRVMSVKNTFLVFADDYTSQDEPRRLPPALDAVAAAWPAERLTEERYRYLVSRVV